MGIIINLYQKIHPILLQWVLLTYIICHSHFALSLGSLSYDWDNISCFSRGRESLFIKTTIENRTDRLGEDFCIFEIFSVVNKVESVHLEHDISRVSAANK